MPKPEAAHPERHQLRPAMSTRSTNATPTAVHLMPLRRVGLEDTMLVVWHPSSGWAPSTVRARRSSHFLGLFVTLLGAKRVTASEAGNSRHTFFFARPYLLRSR